MAIFSKPIMWDCGFYKWNVRFDVESDGKVYYGRVYGNGDMELIHKSRRLPESHKSELRIAVTKEALKIIRVAKRERAAFIDNGDNANAKRIENGLAAQSPTAQSPTAQSPTAQSPNYLDGWNLASHVVDYINAIPAKFTNHRESEYWRGFIAAESVRMAEGFRSAYEWHRANAAYNSALAAMESDK
jgi:hypothetical protein